MSFKPGTKVVVVGRHDKYDGCVGTVIGPTRGLETFTSVLLNTHPPSAYRQPDGTVIGSFQPHQLKLLSVTVKDILNEYSID